MKPLGSAIVAILVGLLALVLLVKLVFFTLKLVGVLIAVAIAVGVYWVVKKKVQGIDRA